MEELYRRVAAEHPPSKRFRGLRLPLWCGAIIGACGLFLPSLCTLDHPLWAPTLYDLYSVSSNLDFSPALFESLKRTMPESPQEGEEKDA